MKAIAKKLGLKDQGIYPDHRCACGVNTRLGKDTDDLIWSWCPKCKCKFNIVSVPKFSYGI